MEIKKYNHKLPIRSYYQKIDCFGRTKVCFITNDLKTVADKVSQGWAYTKIKKGFWLQAPELWLADISEPTKVFYYSDSLINNFAYFLYLKSKTSKQLIKLVKKNLSDNQEVFVSEGPSLETEVRIILENKNTAGNLMFDLYMFAWQWSILR